MLTCLSRLLIGIGAVLLGAAPAIGAAPLDCRDGTCTRRMTAPELLAAAEKAVLDKRFDEARPMLAALSNAPDMAMERHFLQGYLASQTSDLKTAEHEFRAVLRERPDMTRARLELASVLMRAGKDGAADHHFRLAEQDADLPPEIEKTIRQARGVIRSRRNWTFNVDVGLVPDSNINNATDARTINFDFGTGPIPVTLDPDARRKRGIGQSVGAGGSVRLRLKDGLAVVVDANGQFVNQRGSDADDVSGLIAAGPEFTLGENARLSVQAVGFSHWFGGTVAQQGAGIRLSYQLNFDRGQRFGALLDIRQVDSDFAAAYDGESYAAYFTYEYSPPVDGRIRNAVRTARRSAIGRLFERRIWRQPGDRG